MTKAKFSHVCFPRGYCLYNVVVQLLSHIWLFATPWTPAQKASLSFTISMSLLKLMSTELVMPYNHLILCTPFSFCPQSFPASGSFPMNWLFASDGQNIRVSASASVLPTNSQCWFPLELTCLISVLYKQLSRIFSSLTIRKHQFSDAQSSLWSSSHIRTWLLGKP